MSASLRGSEILKLAGEIQEKIRQGIRIYNLTIGDFDPALFPVPEVLKAEIFRAYAADATNYPSSNGMLELRDQNLRKAALAPNLCQPPDHHCALLQFCL